MSFPSPKGRDVEKVLAILGYSKVSKNGGSHARYFKEGCAPVTLAVFGSDEIARGTFSSICRQIGVSLIQFWEIRNSKVDNRLDLLEIEDIPPERNKSGKSKIVDFSKAKKGYNDS